MLSPDLLVHIRKAQQNELTEHIIYTKLAERTAHTKNREILLKIAADEHRHAAFWERISRKRIKPDLRKAWLYIFIARVFGLVFGLKLMERGEDMAQSAYAEIAKVYPAALKIKKDEQDHERRIISMIKEQRLDYVGSIVLGLNDALVELTGALAGFTLALQDTHLIALVGLITGIAASLSMAASSYLSMKEERTAKNPFTGALYTGITYIFTVILLVLPFFFVHSLLLALCLTMGIAITIIMLFTFYTSVTNELPFRRRFLTMAGLSLSVAAFSFLIGYAIRSLLGIDA